MTPQEERAQLVAPMELIGKAIEQLNDLFKDTEYAVYENSVRILSIRLSLLQNHDKYLEEPQLP
jgi:hypothetical protein